jgi:hypothetical protein
LAFGCEFGVRRVETLGKIASGVPWTALFTTIICLTNLVDSVKLICSERGWDEQEFVIHFIGDGDDVVMVTTETVYDLLEFLLPDSVAELGALMTIEAVANDPWDIVWCSHRVVSTSNGPRLCPDPRKTLGRGIWTTTIPDILQNRLNHVRTIAICNSYLHNGLPILQAYAVMLHANTVGGVWAPTQEIYWDSEWIPVDSFVKPAIITNEARLEFELAFGITIAEQLLVEQRLLEFRFDVCNDVLMDGMEFLNHYDPDCKVDIHEP